jgi:Zn-dependent protease
VILLVGFPIHELSHAWVARRLGDDTAARQGRLTLNPLAHLDPLGSIMLMVAGIGWAKPVPVNPYRLQFGSRVGHAIVSAAGPISNLIMASLVAIPWRLGVFDGVSTPVLRMVYTFALVNIALFLFNLIPLAPLDGNSILRGLVGEQGARVLEPLRVYGPMILLGLFLLGYISPQLNVLGRFMGQGMSAIMGVLLGV